MECQPQISEFRNNPENFHTCVACMLVAYLYCINVCKIEASLELP